MSNKLFLVCPFSCMENFIRQKYGEDVFFLTAMAAAFQYSEEEYVAAIKDFITRENITEILIVNDTSCRFINSVLKKEKGFGTPVEKIIQEILIDNFPTIMQNQSLIEQQKQLASLNIKQQAKEIMKPELFLQQIIQNKICIRGVVTAKAENILIEQNTNQIIMEDKHNLKFIDGTFTPAEARKVLLTLISYKINYHQMELFSNEERFNKDLSHSKKRIEELKDVERSLKKIMDSASEKGAFLKLNGYIEIIVLNNQ